MKTLTPSELRERLGWRYATKKFDADKKIDPAAWAALEESLVLSPSSYGLQPWKFIVVEDSEIRRRLRPVSWGQSQVEEASHLVVFARRTDLEEQDVDRFLQRVVEVRGVPAESLSGYRDMMLGNLVNGPRRQTIGEWTARQVYIALGTFMTSAALLGIDTCPLEGLDPAAYDEILGLKGSGYATVAACAAGFRAADDKYAALPKVRFNLRDVVKVVA